MGITAKGGQAGGQHQAGLALNGGQKVSALRAELHEVNVPIAEWRAVIKGLPTLMD